MSIQASNFSLTPYQLQAMLTREFALKFKTGYERITCLQYKGNMLTVGSVIARTRHLTHEDRVTHHGARMVALDTENGLSINDVIYWVQLPKPEILSAFLVRNTPEKVALDIKAYQLCYRPGAESWTGGASKRLGHRDSYRRECER